MDETQNGVGANPAMLRVRMPAAGAVQPTPLQQQPAPAAVTQIALQVCEGAMLVNQDDANAIRDAAGKIAWTAAQRVGQYWFSTGVFGGGMWIWVATGTGDNSGHYWVYWCPPPMPVSDSPYTGGSASGGYLGPRRATLAAPPAARHISTGSTGGITAGVERGGGGGGGTWRPHTGAVPAALHFTGHTPVFHRGRFFSRVGGNLFFFEPSAPYPIPAPCHWVETSPSADATVKAKQATAWYASPDRSLQYTTFNALVTFGGQQIPAQWKVYRSGVSLVGWYVWMCNGAPVGIAASMIETRRQYNASMIEDQRNPSGVAKNPAVDATDRPITHRPQHQHGAGEPPYTGRYNPPIDAMLRLQFEPEEAARIAQSLWDGSWPVGPTARDSLISASSPVPWGSWQPSPAFPGVQYRTGQWANGFFSDIAMPDGTHIVYWAGNENPRGIGVGLTLSEGGGIQPPAGGEGVITAGQSSVQAAAHTMNAALGAHGYSINDTSTYQSFQQAAIDAGNLSGTADGFPGEGTMTVLGNVLANMGEAPNWGPGTVAGGPITGYPWHSVCASGTGDACYDGVNAPELSQWNPNAVAEPAPAPNPPTPTPNQPTPAGGTAAASSTNTGLVLLGGAAVLGLTWAGYYLYKHGKLSGLATHHRRLTA